MGQVPQTKEYLELVRKNHKQCKGKDKYAKEERIRGKLLKLGRPGFAWATKHIFECKRCGATGEVTARYVQLARMIGKEYRPVCHINRWHGLMDEVGKDYYMEMCSWMD